MAAAARSTPQTARRCRAALSTRVPTRRWISRWARASRTSGTCVIRVYRPALWLQLQTRRARLAPLAPAGNRSPPDSYPAATRWSRRCSATHQLRSVTLRRFRLQLRRLVLCLPIPLDNRLHAADRFDCSIVSPRVSAQRPAILLYWIATRPTLPHSHRNCFPLHPALTAKAHFKMFELN